MLNRVSRCTAVKSDPGGISGVNRDERCGCQPKSSPTGISSAILLLTAPWWLVLADTRTPPEKEKSGVSGNTRTRQRFPILFR